MFVLKSRLSQSAKLKMLPNYMSVSDLISDLKKQLLPKESANAIQSKLQRFSQRDLTIDEYGKKISGLFVKLTIVQADGDEQSYKVLKPLNEKMAVKRFADGLRNRHLSTIISARNYDSLKDAVQAAIDEHVTSPGTSNEIFYANNSRGRAYYNNRGRSSNWAPAFSVVAANGVVLRRRRFPAVERKTTLLFAEARRYRNCQNNITRSVQ